MSELIGFVISGFTFGLVLVVLWNVGKVAAALKRLEEKVDALAKK